MVTGLSGLLGLRSVPQNVDHQHPLSRNWGRVTVNILPHKTEVLSAQDQIEKFRIVVVSFEERIETPLPCKIRAKVIPRAYDNA